MRITYDYLYGRGEVPCCVVDGNGDMVNRKIISYDDVTGEVECFVEDESGGVVIDHVVGEVVKEIIHCKPPLTHRPI